jgi:hypothetical protein
MNHYIEAVAIGAVAACVLFVAGVGAGSPSRAATPVSVPAAQVGSAYESAFYKARAELAKAQWKYEFAVADRGRTANRVAAHTASRADLDASIAAVERAGATLKADKAALAAAQANLLARY